MVHETPGDGQHHLSKLSGGQQVVRPLLNVVQGNVEPRRDDATLVEPSSEVDHNLASTMIVNHLTVHYVQIAQ